MRFTVIILVTLAGCSTWDWQKPGASDADYKADEIFCKAQTYSGTEGLVTKASVRRMHSCLESRGWKKVEQ